MSHIYVFFSSKYSNRKLKVQYRELINFLVLKLNLENQLSFKIINSLYIIYQPFRANKNGSLVRKVLASCKIWSGCQLFSYAPKRSLKSDTTHIQPESSIKVSSVLRHVLQAVTLRTQHVEVYFFLFSFLAKFVPDC